MLQFPALFHSIVRGQITVDFPERLSRARKLRYYLSLDRATNVGAAG